MPGATTTVVPAGNAPTIQLVGPQEAAIGAEPVGTTAAAAVAVPPATPTANLVLDRGEAEPGDDVIATGMGCAPGDAVQLRMQDQTVGSAQADAAGHFSTTLAMPALPAGRYQVTATCTVLLGTNVDLIVATLANPETSTLAVFILFILVGGALLIRRSTRGVRHE